MIQKTWICNSAFLIAALLVSGLAYGQDYQFRTKRDPFVDLYQLREKQKPKVRQPKLSKRPPGLAGLLISEVTVVGTAERADQSIVILKGPDEYSYMARPGTKLLDGFLESVSTNQVIFTQELTDDSGRKLTKQVVKQYYTEAR